MSIRRARLTSRILALTGCLSLLAAPAAFAAEVNLALNKPYKVEIEAPDDALAQHEKTYPDTGNKEMTDGRRGAGKDFREAEWVGHLRQGGFAVVIDLGATAKVNRVVAGFLSFHEAGILLPESVEVSFSTDGKNWSSPKSVGVEPSETSGPVTVTIDQLEASARYVRVFVPTNVWVFIDEVEVWGTQ